MVESNKKAFIKFENVKKEFVLSSHVVHAVDDMSFDVDEGEFVVVVGPSGAGKTTVLNLLGGMDNPTSGDIIISEKNISKYSHKQLTEFRRADIGFVFQFYNLMPNLTGLENIALAKKLSPGSPISAEEALESVGLTDRGHHFPSQMSGGEQQRISIARSVAKSSKLILCDEPTGALDYVTGKKILALLHKICKERRITIILVTHNSALKDMADKVIVVKCGKVESITINENPKSIDEIEW
ncbi:MAG: ABC transporter ATP-binding protein [Firmicutes bacterium]|nr:ABC transporter ATP-binding protein [Bacillota bacterium]MCL2255530.1 ABC transporter ATP-binding protein [Bacillota bacterium]